VAEAQLEPAISEAMDSIQGWLDGKLILSKEAVRTLLTEMQRLREMPPLLTLFPVAELSEQDLQEWEQRLGKALEEGKHKPLRWRLPSSPPVPWAADDFMVNSTLSWELDRSWIQVYHEPCQQVVLGDDGDDPDELDAAKLLNLMITHRCEAAQ